MPFLINYSFSSSVFAQQWLSYTYSYDFSCTLIIFISYNLLTAVVNTIEQSVLLLLEQPHFKKKAVTYMLH